MKNRRTDISKQEAEIIPDNTLHPVYIVHYTNALPATNINSSHRHARTTHSNPISNAQTNQPATRTKQKPKHKRTDKSPVQIPPNSPFQTAKMVQPRMVSQPPPSSSATNPAKAEL